MIRDVIEMQHVLRGFQVAGAVCVGSHLNEVENSKLIHLLTDTFVFAN
jgi:hypothetical protein